MNWKDKALDILKESLTPIPHELSELDWKSNLSTKTDRLAQHIFLKKICHSVIFLYNTLICKDIAM